MKTFNKIRLAYLEDIVNDSDVMNRVSREEWIIAKNEGSIGWTDEFLKAKGLSDGGRNRPAHTGGPAKLTLEYSVLILRIYPTSSRITAAPDNPETIFYYLPVKDYMFVYNPKIFPKVKQNIDRVLGEIKQKVTSGEEANVPLDDIIET